VGQSAEEVAGDRIPGCRKPGGVECTLELRKLQLKELLPVVSQGEGFVWVAA
jgi:hypothetical protein